MDATGKQIAKATSLCTTCPKLCRFTCPVALEDGRESSTPTAKMTTASRLAKGDVAMTATSVEPLWRCTGCQVQKEACKHEVDAPDALEAARALAYARGVLPAVIAAKESRFRTDRDPLASELAAAARGLSGNGAPTGDLLLAGCRILRDEPASAARALALLERGGSRAAIWAREPMCCGYPLLALGDREALARNAKAFARSARDARRIVCADPGCAFMLFVVYRELGHELRPEVTTLPEALAALGDRLPEGSDAGKVAYQDPCHLGRRLGVYDEPRRLVARAGGTLVEPFANRELAGCSGSGLGYPLLDPERARGIARRRAGELEATGAERIVTACPSCQRALSRETSLPVVDVAELLESATPRSV